MKKSFRDLGVSGKIIDATESMGFTEPTEVQHEAIPYILNKKDLIVMAKTGSGKTGAFGIPLLQQIDLEVKGAQALILTPTRELAVQVDEELAKMADNLNYKTTALYGQHNINTEIDELRKGASVITGTPGRVFDHINKKTLRTNNIKFLVLDEADRMLDMGFFDQVVQIIKQLPRDRVTLLFSATMPPEIQRICKSYMREPVTLELGSDIKTVDTIKQVYYKVEKREKRNQLFNILKVEQPDSCIIFCNTRSEVDWVHKYFMQKGYNIGALHGGNTQNSRMKTINDFKEGKLQIIVATDVAARGLHIDDLSIVVNYDVPLDNDSYIHRVGRTGRVGNSGYAISLVTVDDMWSFYEIEEHVGALIEELELPSTNYVNECAAKDESEWTKKRIAKAAILATRKPSSRQPNKVHKPGQGRSTQVKPHHKTNESSYKKPADTTSSNKQGHAKHQPVERKPIDRTYSDHKHIKLQNDNKENNIEAKPEPTKVANKSTPVAIETPRSPKSHTPVENTSHAAKSPKSHTPVVKKEIDYRQEAKKLLKKSSTDQKNSIAKKFGSFLKNK